ncbi:MAG: N-acetyltransferase family protein [Candidatus Woesearchaeota archaeon]
MQIRRATKEDIDKLVAVTQTSDLPDSDFDIKPYLEEVFDEGADVFCFEDEVELLGYITLGVDGEISYFAVAKEHRGSGIGSLLLKKALSAAEKKNFENVFLDVRNDNLDALLIYLRRGFLITDAYDKKTREGTIKKLRMEKKL